MKNAKVVGFVKIPKKKHYQRPLKVSLGLALRDAFKKRGKLYETSKG